MGTRWRIGIRGNATVMGIRSWLALGLGLVAAAVRPSFATDHLVFGVRPGASFDLYQDSTPLPGQNSSAGGVVSFAATGGGTFQVVASGETVDITPPARVTDLVASSPTDNSFTLRWHAVGDDGLDGTASVYDVRYSEIPLSESTWNTATQATGEPTPHAPGTLETFVLSGLQAGHQYYVGIKVGDDVLQWSLLSNIVIETTTGGGDTTGPGAITDLAVASEAETSITLDWTATGDDGYVGTATEYDVRYASSSINSLATWNAAQQATGEPVPSPAGEAEEFTVTGLDAGTTYYFAIKARDDAGTWSALSNSPHGTTLSGGDVTPPEAITDLSASSLGPNSIRIDWSAPGDDGDQGQATVYDARYSTVPITSANFTQMPKILSVPFPLPAGSGQTATVGGLQANTRYYFAIKARDDANLWSALSNVPNVTTDSDGTDDNIPPAVVDDLTVSTTGTATATLRWTAPGDDGDVGQATSFDIRYSLSPITTDNWPQADLVTGEPVPGPVGTEHVIMVGGLQADEDYYFALRTSDEVGNESDLSNVAEGHTLEPPQDVTPPAPIDDLTLADTEPLRAHFEWTATGDDGYSGQAYSFDFRMSGAPLTLENWDEAVAIDGLPDPGPIGTQHDIWVDDLPADSTVYFAIRAIDEGDNVSDLSNVVEVIVLDAPDDVPPGPVGDLAGRGISPQQLELTWTAPADDGGGPVSGYEILVHTSPLGQSSSEPLHFALSSTPNEPGEPELYVADGLEPTTVYYCYVRSVDEVGNWSELSNEAVAATLDDTPPPPQGDETPPAAIDDLTVVESGYDYVVLEWTATGDDGSEGQADAYDFRMSTEALTPSNFGEATPVETAAPLASGETETLRIEGLSSGSEYYFALEAIDVAENVSALSNVVSIYLEYPPDLLPPEAIADLSVLLVDDEAVTLGWTTPMDSVSTGADADGSIYAYDMRYAEEPLTTETWETSSQANAPTPTDPGRSVVWTISGLAEGTQYFFGLRSQDEAGNWSDLSNVAEAMTTGGGDDPPDPPQPDSLAPALIDDLSLEALDSWSARIAWTATGDDGDTGTAAEYELRRLVGSEESLPDPTAPGAWDGASPVALDLTPSTSGTAESNTRGALIPGSYYAYALRAIDEAGNAGPVAWTPVVQLPYVEDLFAPESITDLAGVASDSTTVHLTWTAPSDLRPDQEPGPVARYELRWSVDEIDESTWGSAEGSFGFEAEDPAGSQMSFDVEGLLSGTEYRFAVRAIDPSDNIAPLSNVVVVQMPEPEPEDPGDPDPPADETPPSRVTSLVGYVLGETSLRLTWYAPGDDGSSGQAAKYTVRWGYAPVNASNWSTLESLPDVALPSPSGEVETYDWEGREPGVTYYFALVAEDEAGNQSPISNAISVTMPQIQDTAPPSVPEGLHTQASQGIVELTWEASPEPDVAGYRVHRRLLGESVTHVVADHVPQETFSDASAEAGATYAYSVSSKDNAGNVSARSSEAWITIPASLPTLVVAVEFLGADPVRPADDQVVIRWAIESGPELVGFHVFREQIENEGAFGQTTSPEGPAERVNAELLEGAGPHVFVESPRPEPGAYRYWVQAVGSTEAQRAYLDPISVTVPKWSEGVLSLYPNPMRDRMTVQFSLEEAGPAQVEVFDVTGRLRMQEQLGQLDSGLHVWEWQGRTSDNAQLPNGTYFLRFRAGSDVQTQRFVVVRAGD
ncbi:MAG: fibronectin type III domain-containing protein [Candidatus Eisenbacteria bacterium]|uniref:Fibronectin type III domain-containing protein n=1 Tax=Eiseniibacteriota bacterium TaxID=2212470 RepID=A0A956NCA2_UNCEI|nr:fibronectin type III domain-containing protein [Candidatus Eisenbacteria bacterium]